MTEPNENIMRRVSSLLERAMHPGTGEAERESAQAMADKLMAKHRLDRALLDFGKKKEERREPVKAVFERLKLIDENTANYGARDYTEYTLQGRMNNLRMSIFKHAGCRYNYAQIGENHQYGYVVIGFQEDIYFAEILWNTIFMDISTKMYPTWKKDRSFDENVFTIKSAGYSWSQVREVGLAHEGRDHIGVLTRENAGSKLRTAYKREAKRRGIVVPPGKQQPTDPHWWRQSFVQSYSTRLSQRLMALQAEHEEYQGLDNLPAIRQDSDLINQKFWEEFPEEHPDEVAKRRAEWERLNAEDTAPKTRAVRPAKIRYADSAAWEAGVRAADSINLSTAKAAGDKKGALE